jgi:DNA-binding NarL/FixJ family response regulator
MRKITRREQELIDLIFAGCTTQKKLAEQMVVDVQTVRSHLYHLHQKYEVESTLEVVLAVVKENGYVHVQS